MKTLIHNNEKFKTARTFHNRRMVTVLQCNIMPLLKKINLKTMAIAGNVYSVTPCKKTPHENRASKKQSPNCMLGL